MRKTYTKGFTLIELLIAIAIVGIIAVVAFVALNPAKRLLDSRNAKRYTDVSAILEAIKVAQVDDGGAYKGSGTAGALGDEATVPSNGANRMIVSSGTTCAARVVDTDCDVAIALNSCVFLPAGYIGTYLSALPESPTSADALRIDWNALALETGYYLKKNLNGTITVGSCDGEPETGGPVIEITR